MDSIDLTNFDVCIECVRDKHTKKNGAYRDTYVLELIHTDIYGLFPTPLNDQQYFISFIDDYSRYAYMFLIHKKSQSLDVFKSFKAKVESQLCHTPNFDHTILFISITQNHSLY